MWFASVLADSASRRRLSGAPYQTIGPRKRSNAGNIGIMQKKMETTISY